MNDGQDFAMLYPVPNLSPAEVASEAAVVAHIEGKTDEAVPLFNKAAVELRREDAQAQNPNTDEWRDPNVPSPPPLAPMPPPPTPDQQIVHLAVHELSSSGEPGRALINDWGGPDNPNFAANIGYAR